MSTTYPATAAREGRWWIITVPAVNGVTQARSLADARQAAAELVAVTLDLPHVDDVEIDLTVERVGDVEVAASVEVIRARRASAAEAEAEAARSTRALALALHAEHVTLRDIGTVLGMSYQRAHQLVSS